MCTFARGVRTERPRFHVCTTMALRNIVSRVTRQAPKVQVVRNVTSRAVAPVMVASRAPFMGKLALALGGVSLAFAVQQVAECKAQVPYWGLPGTANERTFIAIKPDGIQRGLVGEVIQRFEKKGYKLVALKLLTPTKAKAEAHYADLAKRPFFAGLVSYFSSGPIIAMVWEGPGAILTGRKILGATNPNDAAVGTIRGDYCLSVGRNLIHGSDGPESAAHEIKNWFTEGEIFGWSRNLEEWISADN